ncbi:MAG: 2-dehydropantoate 2-reductase [Desulfobulbaceae bacterium]|nr:2-dehydropantoate 2-reductase [Desulfobulbaceae bacterium]
MKTTIIGSGAMGCLFGGLLTEAGYDVSLLDVRPEHVEKLLKNGLSISRSSSERKIRVKAFTNPDEIDPAELIIIFVKHAHTAEAGRTSLKLAGVNSVVLTLQNGMGNAEILAEILGEDRVICGTTAQGAMLTAPGRIQHSGEGPTIIGTWNRSDHPVIRTIADLLNDADIETQVANDIGPIIWNKLLVNVGINAITALTGIKNGQLLELDATRSLVAAAINEAATVARTLGIALAENHVENVFAIAKATGPNRSSMGQDVDARRPTEINAINGYIVQQAANFCIAVPVNRTLTDLILTLQGHY